MNLLYEKYDLSEQTKSLPYNSLADAIGRFRDTNNASSNTRQHTSASGQKTLAAIEMRPGIVNRLHKYAMLQPASELDLNYYSISNS